MCEEHLTQTNSNKMRPKYRVEAFIVPQIINNDELSTSNEMDDVKIANNKLKLNSPIKSASSNIDQSTFVLTSPKKIINIDVVNEINDESDFNEIYSINEPIYDVPCNVKAKFPASLANSNMYEDRALPIPPKVPIRTCSLVSIDERGETDNIIEEFCFHGYKNGCTATTQRPEQVSEEIFQDNWLRRLESLRERETSISEKETLLQERERLLFKKERELRILERLVREKLKQADLRLKLCQSSGSIESTNYDVKTRTSEDSQKTQSQRSKIEKSSLSYFPMKAESSCFPQETNERKFSMIRDSEMESEKISRLQGFSENSEKGMKNPPNSKSSLLTSSSATTSHVLANEQFVKYHGESMRNSFPSSSNAYSSLRMIKPKIRPKISYDDLDSTLSADIGDSSYVVTSRKFDPAVFKKPQAFTRSTSLRRTKQQQEQEDAARDTRHVNYSHNNLPIRRNNDNDKILKRTIENNANFVAPNDNIKYQDYGLIDERSSTRESSDEMRNSYLNLERGIDVMRMEKNLSRSSSRARPNSWNEESNEWLRKKRHAYNMSTMRIPNENFENKENGDLATDGREKMKKTTKKKDSRTKKFGIFR